MAWRCSGATNEELIDNLARSGILTNNKICDALKQVDRKNYAPTNPYQDAPQSIGYQATISAPHMHAHAIEYLFDQLSKDCSKVLGKNNFYGILNSIHNLNKLIFLLRCRLWVRIFGSCNEPIQSKRDDIRDRLHSATS